MINLGLQRISRLLAPLFTAHPTLPFKAIHIAGTNGKGSVAALISTVLSASGYRVGRFTSPHVIDRWDCITLDQQVVDRDLFLSVERDVKSKAGAGPGGEDASEFEILTATAFELFAAEKVDVAVVECGLGGRLDATNVLRPQDVLVSVLTKVGLDHTEFLGETVEAVAREKVGIFKPGVPVVVDESNDGMVLEVVRKKVEEVEVEVEEEELASGEGAGLFVLPEDLKGRLVTVQGLAQLGLADHQVQNLVTAFTAYYIAEEQLEKLRTAIPSTTPSTSPTTSTRPTVPTTFEERISKITQSLPSLVRQAQSSLRGRLEWLSLSPTVLSMDREIVADADTDADGPVKVLLDGAHNPQSAHALADYVDGHIRGDCPVTWVLAAKNDKDVRSMLSILLRSSDNIVTCSFGPVDGMPWVKSMDASQLAGVVREFITDGVVEVAQTGCVDEAVRKAVKIASGRGSEQIVNCQGTGNGNGNGKGPICIAGSLYLVGDTLRWLREAEISGK
ncbi:hypothetical protein A1O1_06424 [Capronia coronata CBS 617.96]|uniref:Uncharacterized protein n=1 Tax=Capronia coronata CBS 617.96 TaxID=1182541 RepID=W9Y8U7_9EURO|nr:uncharacterized protein A1O1_06424 [Capronia coronata CBS 617.96]EXJ86055.1 hypothetical protein A1O1_06424 [Capronia coronata CBS 617.96]